MRFGFSALILCGVLALAGPATAQVATPLPGSLRMLTECNGSRFYDAASADAPAPVAAALKAAASQAEGKRLVFRICRDLENNTHYFLREPRPNRAGVCRTIDKEIFPGTAEDIALVEVLYDGRAPDWYFTLAGWKGIPPDTWRARDYRRPTTVLGFVAGGDCPPGNDPRYIPLFNMSDGMLKTFQAAWDEITSSPEAMKAAMDKTIPPQIRPGRTAQLIDSRFVAGVTSGRAPLTRVGCSDGGCAAGVGAWNVAFEFTPTGIVWTGFSWRVF